jgi:hypothetical protein
VAGAWTPGTDLRYQWNRSGRAITGATAAKYTLKKADQGKRISVTVTGTKPSYEAAATASATTAKVKAAKKLKASTPKLRGTPVVGGELTVAKGAWTAGATFTYTWYAGNTKVKTGKSATLTVTKAHVGTRIKVRVTGAKPGYTTRSKTARTATVVRRR